MSRQIFKYTKQIAGDVMVDETGSVVSEWEIFEVSNADSFDEAFNSVDKAVRERKLQIAEQKKKEQSARAPKVVLPPPVSMPGKDRSDDPAPLIPSGFRTTAAHSGQQP